MLLLFHNKVLRIKHYRSSYPKIRSAYGKWY